MVRWLDEILLSKANKSWIEDIENQLKSYTKLATLEVAEERIDGELSHERVWVNDVCDQLDKLNERISIEIAQAVKK